MINVSYKNSVYYVVRFCFIVINNNLFLFLIWWKLIDYIFCGIYVIYINDVFDFFVYKICLIDMNDVNNMFFVYVLNRMIWLDDFLII